MRICIISPGVVHAVSRTIAICGQFEEVHFIDMKGNADFAKLERHGVICYKISRQSRFAMTDLGLHKLLNRIKPEVIICHFASGDHFFHAILYGRCPVAAIAMGHDILYDRGDADVSRLRQLLTRMALRRTAYIAAKSKYLETRIRSYGVMGPVHINFWGADLLRFRSGNRALAKRQLLIPTDCPVILSPRAIEPRLNINLIADSFQYVVKQHPRAILIILGRVSPQYLKIVEETISRLRLSSRVQVIGEIGEDDMITYYQASDVVVSMANSEGFPNTLLEVMGCKIPMVVGRIPQIEELLSDGQNARICQIDPHQTGKAILDILGNPEKAFNLAANAYDTATRHANIKTNGVKFSNQLKRAMAEKTSTGFVKKACFIAIFAAYLIQRTVIK